MQEAVFYLKNYNFPKISIDYNHEKGGEVNIQIKPSGEFNKEKSEYKLLFNFSAASGGEKPFVEIVCESTFKLKNVNSVEEIPPFFFQNSIAILFPYIRAFVSTITLQANNKPMVLPTMNLSSLEEPLKNSTTEVK